MAYPIIMHVNYCEQGQTVEEICRKAAAWGYGGVEFRRKRSGVEETTEEYLDKLEAGVTASGLGHVLFGKLEPAEGAVVDRHITLALQHVNFHRGLIISGSGKGFVLLGGDGAHAGP